jgi:hypothetical protein
MQRLLTSLGLGFALFGGYQSSASSSGPSGPPRRQDTTWNNFLVGRAIQ